MGESAGAKFNMLLLSIKDEQLQNILSNKYLNSSAQGEKKKHVAYPLITSVSRGSERQLFDANKQTRQTRWAHYRRAKAPSGDTQPLRSPPSPLSLLPLNLSLSHSPVSLTFLSSLLSFLSTPSAFISCTLPLSCMFLVSHPSLFLVKARCSKAKRRRVLVVEERGGWSQ